LGEYVYLRIAVDVGDVKMCCETAERSVLASSQAGRRAFKFAELLRREYERIYVRVIEESGRSFETAAKAKLTGLLKPHQRSVDRRDAKLIGSVVQQ
jgi:hypothetical protein